MATSKQILANRENAKLAGVKTEVGKSKVRFNALKHGLSAKHILTLDKDICEDYQDYEEILAGFIESIAPTNFLETALVEQMARAYFKLKRCEVLENKCFSSDFELYTSTQELKLDEHKLNISSRYRSQIEGQFYRARGALLSSRQPQQLDLFCKNGDNNG